MADRKGAKATKLDTLSARQGIGDAIEDGVDHAFHIAVIEMGIGFGQLVDQF